MATVGNPLAVQMTCTCPVVFRIKVEWAPAMPWWLANELIRGQWSGPEPEQSIVLLPLLAGCSEDARLASALLEGGNFLPSSRLYIRKS